MKKEWYDSVWAFIGAIIIVLVLLIAIVGTVNKIVKEFSCNQNVVNQPQLVEGDYKFWTTECFVTTENNQIIPWSKYRPVSEVE